MVDEDRRIIMNVVLYTTHCSNCKGIEKMLTQKNIPFTEITDVEEMMKKGIMSAPVLEVDGDMMNVGQAAKWIMNQ